MSKNNAWIVLGSRYYFSISDSFPSTHASNKHPSPSRKQKLLRGQNCYILSERKPFNVASPTEFDIEELIKMLGNEFILCPVITATKIDLQSQGDRPFPQ